MQYVSFNLRYLRLGALLFSLFKLHAQIVTDGTLGRPGALSGPAFQIPADLGRQVGPNLFHSFSKFNVAQNESATFSGPSTVQNILARVTGGSPSSIDGTLRSSISGANLYLINPSGLMFGPNAALDISGSFVASTADYVKMTDGGRFEARSPANSVLTAAPVEKFGFLTPGPSKITVDAGRLTVSSGQSITMVGGDIELKNGALLRAPGGAIKVVSSGAEGELGDTPELADLSTGGAVTLTDKSQIDTTGEHGGPVTVRAAQLVLDGSSITANTTGAVDGQPMDVAIKGDLLIQNSGQLSTTTSGTGRSGALSVTANTVTLKDGGEISASSNGSGDAGQLAVNTKFLFIAGFADPNTSDRNTGILNTSGASATGNGGSVAVRVQGPLQAVDGGMISASTDGAGNAGDITVAADSITLDMGTSRKVTGIVAFSYAADGFGSGGNLEVETRQLQIFGGAEIAAATWGHGPGGNVHVKADSILMDGRGAHFNTTINSYSINTGDGGPAGDVTVEAETLTCVAGSFISSSTGGLGLAGKVSVTANNFSADGSGSTIFTGIRSTSDNPYSGGNAGKVTLNVKDSINLANGAAISSNTSGSGNAGEVTVLADTLTMLAGGQISSDTGGTGDAGKITIHAGSMRIEGSDDDRFQGVTSNTYDGSSGNAGDVEITVDRSLVLKNGGRIASTSFGTGNAGQVSISAESMVLNGQGGNHYLTGIASDTDNEGHAGHVSLNIVNSLELVNGAQISSDTSGTGDAGTITIHAGSMKIEGADDRKFQGVTSNTDDGSSGNAGDVEITVDGSFVLQNGGRIATTSFGTGNGGQVDISAKSMVIDGQGANRYVTGISSDTYQEGHAGRVNIHVNESVALLNGGQISSQTQGAGNGGAVSVTAGSILIKGNQDGRGGSSDTVISSSSAESATGTAGAVSIIAGTLTIDGSGTDDSTTIGITSDSLNERNGGAAGKVTINVRGLLTVKNDGQISSDTYGSGNAGDVIVDAGDLVIDGANSPNFTGISSDSLSEGKGGNAGQINVRVSGSLQVLNTAQISSDTYGRGNGGDVIVTAHDVKISGATADFGTSITSDSRSTAAGAGKAGDVNVEASGRLEIINGGLITSDTYGSGNGGAVVIKAGTLAIEGNRDGNGGLGTTAITSESLENATGQAGDVSVSAGSLRIDRGTSEYDTGISSDSDNIGRGGNGGNINVIVTGPLQLLNGATITSDTYGQGNAGKVNVITGTLLTLFAGGEISSDTHGPGRGGDVSVNAHALSIDRAGSRLFSGISSESRPSGAGGDAGTVTVKVDSTLQINGQISSSTFGTGNAGAVAVSAHDLFADAQNSNADRGIISKSYNSLSGGDAGRVEVSVASQLRLSNNAIISSTTLGAGKAGEVSVTAGKLTLDGGGNPGVFAQTFGSGEGGDVAVHADELLMHSGSLSTQSTATGDGGTVEVHAKDLEMQSGATISSASSAAGKSGTVLVDVTGPISLHGHSQIATSAEHSDAGKLVINNGSSIFLENSTISGRADKNGGEVDITSPGLVSLFQSQIISAARSGKGGNISIDPRFVILNQSTISANAVFGNGGNITIDTGHLIQSADSLITASSQFGLSGTVSILGPSVDLSGSLASLSGEFVSADTRLPERCAVRLPGNISSFIVVGRGGLPLDPYDPLPIFPGFLQGDDRR